MKRVVALLMTMVLLVGCGSAMAESTFFSSSVLSTVDYTVDDWTGSATSRAAFAVVAAVEYMTELGSSFELDYTKDIYVCKTGEMVGVLFCISGGEYAYLLYSPDYGIIFYDPEQDLGNDSLVIETALKQTADAYYTVTTSEFSAVASSLADAIADDE